MGLTAIIANLIFVNFIYCISFFKRKSRRFPFHALSSLLGAQVCAENAGVFFPCNSHYNSLFSCPPMGNGNTAQTKPGNCFPGFCCLDAHELLFLGGEFLFGDDAGIEEVLVLLDLGDGIGGGGRSSRNSRGGNGLAGSGAFLREARYAGQSIGQGLQVLDALIVLDAVLVQIRDIADDNGAGALKLVKAPIGMLEIQLNVEFLERLGDIDAGIAGADLLIPVSQTLHRFLHLPLDEHLIDLGQQLIDALGDPRLSW